MTAFHYWDHAQQQRWIIRGLVGVAGLLAVVSLGLGVGWYHAPRTLRIYLPPEISHGAWLTPNQVPPHTVYAFAAQIMGSLQTWLTDGTVDYPKQLHAYRAYLSPESFKTFHEDYQRRLHKGTLARQRMMTLMPYYPHAVNALGNHTWHVNLTLHLTETLAEHVIKSVDLCYPIEVAQINQPLNHNPWGLVIQRLSQPPYRMTTGEKK